MEMLSARATTGIARPASSRDTRRGTGSARCARIRKRASASGKLSSKVAQASGSTSVPAVIANPAWRKPSARPPAPAKRSTTREPDTARAYGARLTEPLAVATCPISLSVSTFNPERSNRKPGSTIARPRGRTSKWDSGTCAARAHRFARRPRRAAWLSQHLRRRWRHIRKSLRFGHLQDAALNLKAP